MSFGEQLLQDLARVLASSLPVLLSQLGSSSEFEA